MTWEDLDSSSCQVIYLKIAFSFGVIWSLWSNAEHTDNRRGSYLRNKFWYVTPFDTSSSSLYLTKHPKIREGLLCLVNKDTAFVILGNLGPRKTVQPSSTAPFQIGCRGPGVFHDQIRSKTTVLHIILHDFLLSVAAMSFFFSFRISMQNPISTVV